MKVMVIQPPSIDHITTGPPLGLGYLASFLEREGHNVKIVESRILRYKPRHVKKEIKKFDPDIMGISATTHYIYMALDIVKFAKENNPNCLTVMGGPHPTLLPEEVLEQNPYVDVIVRGEGELTLTELAEKFKKYGKEKFSEIKGISYNGNGKVFHNPPRPLIEDLDSIPFPAYHLMKMKKYRISFYDDGLMGKYRQPYGTINTARGCPYDCIFCSSNKLVGRKWRPRSAESVVEELKFLEDKYQREVVDFRDDTFSLDISRVKKICELIQKEKIGISWSCQTRVNLFNEDMASSLKKGGCHLVFFGFESGVQKTLDFFNKGIKVEDSIRAVEIARKYDLDAAGYFILGIPGETIKDVEKTIEFAKNLRLKYAGFTLLTPYPGTKIYEYAVENNLLLTRDWSEYTLWKSVMKIPGFDPKELEKIRHKADIQKKMWDNKK